MGRRLAALVVSAGAVGLAAAALGGTGVAGPQAVTLTVPAASVGYGEEVIVAGTVEPAAAGEQVVLELDDGTGPVQVARAATDGFGSFLATFQATHGGLLTALGAAGGHSEPVELTVTPRVRLKARPGVAFAGARLAGSIAPATYAGRVTLTVKQGGAVVAHASARARGGRFRVTVPTPGVGRFTVVVSIPEAPGLAATFATEQVSARGRTLGPGASGPDVRALVARLSALRFRVPGISSTFGYSLTDSVIAFQKAYGLPRTGVVGEGTWRMLGRAEVLRPRRRGPSPHIEVDKTRQILLVVERGAVVAVMPVSSGATGNTPEGTHHIRWKALATTTWLGSAILYRTMTFFGNSFAIHGFPSVPAYPASHGCVRIPIWTADWLYDRSAVGETVYVYR
jgi:lipoprotein-anchoring transpeptidase ErfK/SrfK